MRWLADPRLFPALVMSLNLACAIRWAVAGKWIDAFYWCCALGLNLCLTLKK